MALAEALAAFAERHPDVADVFYATTPPRILIEAMARGRLELGNLSLSVEPHAFISPIDVLDDLHRGGAVGEPTVFAASRGTAILVRKGNPRAVRTMSDLMRPDVRLALSNPVTEQASFAVYAAAIAAHCAAAGSSAAAVTDRLRGDAVVKSRVIHHREIPELLAAGHADASLVYTHLALRYARVFPDLFEMHAGSTEPVTRYGIALVGSGGDFGAALVAFMCNEAGPIYRQHGLDA